MRETLGIDAEALRDLGLRDADDRHIFDEARALEGVIVLTKDIDFVQLLHQLGPPPKVIWLRCGNTSNRYLRTLMSATLPTALRNLDEGDALVEIIGQG